MSKIKIAIAGLGNCASSLLQGVEYYRQTPDNGTDSGGLIRYSIGPYRPFDFELVAAFDIDRRKVGRPAGEAIFAPPNNTKVFCPQLHDPGPQVQMGPVLDGFPPHMLDRSRLSGKKTSKTEAVQSQLAERLDDEHIHIGPSDYVAWQNDNKVCFLRMEGRGFASIPLHLELRLSVEDSPNSAGVGIDAIRMCQVALDHGISGPLLPASAYYMRRPPVQMKDVEAAEEIERFLSEMTDAPRLHTYAEPAATPIVWPAPYQGTKEKATDKAM